MRTIYTLLLFTVFVNSNAQEKSITEKYRAKNEIKVNGLYLFWGATEISYERILNQHSSVGISAFSEFNGESFSLSPYYRYYFGKKYNQGFFLEAQTFLSAPNNPFHNIKSTNNSPIFGAGIGTGYKYITKNNIILEANTSFGTSFNNDSNVSNSHYFRLGATIGYRF